MYAEDRMTPQLRRSRHTSLPAGERMTTHGADRQCAAPECSTRLSRYNPSQTCGTHKGWADTRQRSYG